MFAITTADALHISDSSSVKRGPPLIPSCLDLDDHAVATSWTPDFSHIYIAFAHTIRKFNPSRNTLSKVYSSKYPDENITSVLAQDTDSFVFSTTTQVHLVKGGSTVRTFEDHADPITSLSLSYGGQFLASLSSNSICVYDLFNNKRLPVEDPASWLSAACFHFCIPSRLLVAADQSIYVYDVDHPGRPSKIITVPDIDTNPIFALCSSPYSEALVVAATNDGTIVLLDLERDNQSVRTFHVNDGLTAVHFSPEGAAIYACTSSGNLLCFDLRSLDKPPREIPVGTGSQPILSFSTQPKVKSAGLPRSNSVASMCSKTVGPSDPKTLPTNSKAVSKSPSKSRTPVVVPSNASRLNPKTAKPTSPISTATKTVHKAILSPSRDPHGNVGANAASTKAVMSKTTQPRSPRKSSSQPVLASKPDRNGAAATRTKPSPLSADKATTETPSGASAVRKAPSASTLKSSASSSSSLAPKSHAPTSKPIGLRRSQTNPSIPSAQLRIQTRAESAPTVSQHSGSRPTSAVSTTSSSNHSSLSNASSKRPQPLKQGSGANSEPASISIKKPTPTTPPSEPITKGKGKNVGFKDADNIAEEDEDGSVPSPPQSPTKCETMPDMRIQLSPLRQPSRTGKSATIIPVTCSTNNPGLSWLDVPSNSTQPFTPLTGGGATTETPQDLLRTIVQDAMYDFQLETKSELMGLHLDLVRMGRTWKSELRTLMDEYVGDLKELREENERLRRENERLRRGAC